MLVSAVAWALLKSVCMPLATTAHAQCTCRHKRPAMTRVGTDELGMPLSPLPTLSQAPSPSLVFRRTSFPLPLEAGPRCELGCCLHRAGQSSLSDR